MHPVTASAPPRRGAAAPAPAPGGDRAGRGRAGEGTSTLAALLAPAWDMGVMQAPGPAGGLRPGSRPVVLVSANGGGGRGLPGGDPARRVRAEAVDTRPGADGYPQDPDVRGPADALARTIGAASGQQASRTEQPACKTSAS